MKVELTQPPRYFQVRGETTLADCGRIRLEPGEQVTFVTEGGSEYDVARKEWGYYATPSLNGRLADQGWDSALVRNREGRYYVMLVERDQRDVFSRYLRDDSSSVVCWLHDSDGLEKLARSIASDPE